MGPDQRGHHDTSGVAGPRQGHRGTRRCGGTVRTTGRRSAARHRRDDGRPAGAADRVRGRGPGSAAAGRGSAADTAPGQPGGALPGDGTLLHGQQYRHRGRGDDDVHGIDPAQPRRRSPRGLERKGSAGACFGTDHDRRRGQLAAAGRAVHRLGVQPPAGVGSAGLRALRPHSGCRGRRSHHRLGALRAQGPGDAGTRTRRGPGARLGAVRRLGRRHGDARGPPTDHRQPRLPPHHAVPARATTRLARDPLPRCGARRAVACAGVRAHHAPRRSTRRRAGRGGRRAGGHRVGHRGARGTARSPPAPGRQHLRWAGRRTRAPELAESMRSLAGLVARGRCAADEFADHAVRLGIATATTQLAQGHS